MIQKQIPAFVYDNPFMLSCWKSLAEPHFAAFPEVPAALTTGVIDGQENPVSVISANKFYELQEYITLMVTCTAPTSY
ncbi:hypothetical protein OH492_13480 [Vibrio chagasii]|nr:hypothetical protein [Vibrio chagasii]